MLNKINLSASKSNNNFFSKEKSSKNELEELFFNSSKEKDATKEEKIYDKVSNYSNPIYFDKKEKFNVMKNIDLPLLKYFYEDETFIYYYMNIEKIFGDKLDANEKIDYASIIQKEDNKSKNCKKILYSTPMKINKKINMHLKDEVLGEDYKYDGDMLEFYNESDTKYYFPLFMFGSNFNDLDKYSIITRAFPSEKKNEIIQNVCKYYADIKKNSQVYSDYYSNLSDKYLNSVIFYYSPEEYNDTIGGFYGKTSSGKIASDIIINVEYLEDEYNEQLATYTHELTHAIDNASSAGYKNDITSTVTWKDVYDQIVEMQPEGLWDYAFSTPGELFAEGVSEFYANDSYPDNYNKEDLMAININANGKEMTFYDFLDKILSGEKICTVK